MRFEFEIWLARVLLLNGLLGIGVALGKLGPAHDGHSPVLWAMAALACGGGWLWLRGKKIGCWCAMLYYALQVPSYYSHDGSVSFSIKAGISIATVMRLDSGVLVINGVALALLLATVWIMLTKAAIPK